MACVSISSGSRGDGGDHPLPEPIYPPRNFYPLTGKRTECQNIVHIVMKSQENPGNRLKSSCFSKKLELARIQVLDNVQYHIIRQMNGCLCMCIYVLCKVLYYLIVIYLLPYTYYLFYLLKKLLKSLKMSISTCFLPSKQAKKFAISCQLRYEYSNMLQSIQKNLRPCFLSGFYALN